MIIARRDVGTAVVLSIITCGIYYLYWEYKLWSTLYKANDMTDTAGTDIILSIITCGIYMIYMHYKAGKMEASAHARYGLPPKDDTTLYLVLTILSLAIITTAILQSNINNNLVDVVNNSNGKPQPPLQ